MLDSVLRLSCRKMGAQSAIRLNPSPKWLILRRNGFQVIINDDFLEEGGVTANNSSLRTAYRFYIRSLTTASGSRLFGSVVEHWIIDPVARVRFPPKSWEFFQPKLLCFVLCYGYHVIRWGLSPELDLILRQNGLILRRNGFQVIINDDFFKRGSVTANNSTLRIVYRVISNL